MKIDPFAGKDCYKQNNVCWHEGGRYGTRCFADFGEAELIAPQISVRLANRLATGKEASHRNDEILQYGEEINALVAAVARWATARNGKFKVLRNNF
ncbi:MAG: hypothetical protein WCL19_11860 [Verrucomicrobiota bacterium]